MTYASTSPNNPLATKSWRRRHSAWLLAVIFGFGAFSFVGFLYCAIRVQTRKWWTRAAVTAGLSVISWILMTLFVESTDAGTGSTASTEQPGPGDDIATGFLLAVWIGMMIYGFIVNREYLRWRAGHSEASAWYNQPAETHRPINSAPAPTPQAQPTAALPPPPTAAPPPLLGVDPSTYYAPAPTASPPPPSATSSRVDVNSADAAKMSANLGLDATTAARIVSEREGRRGFQDIDDLVAATSLQPHELMRIRGKVTFGPYAEAARPGSAAAPAQTSPQPEPRSGRILDY